MSVRALMRRAAPSTVMDTSRYPQAMRDALLPRTFLSRRMPWLLLVVGMMLGAFLLSVRSAAECQLCHRGTCVGSNQCGGAGCICLRQPRESLGQCMAVR